MKLSIVTTLYYSAPYIQEFYNRIKKAVSEITNDHEIIFVNDGSPDNSLEICLSLHKMDSKIKIIDLSKNYGHHKAIMTGLAHCQGEFVFYIDCDLEEEPELLIEFYKEMINDRNIDVIYGVQERREGNFVKRIVGSWIYDLFNLLSDYEIPKDVMTIRLMTKRYVENLVKFRDKDPVFPILCLIAGYSQKAIKVAKSYKGKTAYSIPKRFSLVANVAFSFCSRSLRFMFILGLIISFFSFLYLLWLLYSAYFLDVEIEVAVPILISTLFLGGLIMIAFSIIYLYLFRVFDEVKDRPFTVIRKIYP